MRDAFAIPLGINFTGTEADRKAVYEEIGYATLDALTKNVFEQGTTATELTLFAILAQMTGENFGPVKYFESEMEFKQLVEDYLRYGGDPAKPDVRKTTLEILGEWLHDGFITDQEFFDYTDKDAPGGAKGAEQIIKMIRDKSIFGENRFNNKVIGEFDGLPIVKPVRGSYAKKMEELKRKYILAGRKLDSRGDIVWDAATGGQPWRTSLLENVTKYYDSSGAFKWELRYDGTELNQYHEMLNQLGTELCKGLLNNFCDPGAGGMTGEFGKLFAQYSRTPYIYGYFSGDNWMAPSMSEVLEYYSWPGTSNV